jgi:hypothetical protein
MKTYLLIVLLLVAVARADLTGDWCGTIPALKDFNDGKLPIRPTLSGPEIIIDRTNFRVHYTTQGRDRANVSYAESTASYLQYCWTKHIDSLGWASPPPDGTLGGDSRYDYYITSLSSNIAGVTYSEAGYSNPYPNGCCSHIRISNTLDIIGLAVVVSHEFTHACQFRYSSAEQSWWYENIATWMEDETYPNSNDYIHYLTSSPNPFSNPELPINTFTGLYQYAGAAWGMFLENYYDADCPRKIWEYQGIISGQNTLSGMNYVMTNQYGSNLQTALKNYALWRYFTGIRADTVHYFKEGNLWPLARMLNIHNSYPISGNQGSYPVTGPGGNDYIQFQNGGGKFFISFDGQDGYQWSCFVIGYRPNNLSTVTELSLNTQIQVSDSFLWQDNDHVALIPVVTQWQSSTGALNFNYSANIRVFHDVGIQQITGFPTTAVDSGAVISAQALIKNYGLYSEIFPIQLTVGNSYINTQSVSLNPNDSSWVSFAQCTLRVRDYNAYKCTTLLTQDERTTNNSISDRVFVRVQDVATIMILEPPAQVNLGSFIHPQARVRNNGNLREIFDVDFYIGNWYTTKQFSLAPNLEYDMVFDSTWHATDTGYYVVKCSTKLTGDVNSNNDWFVSNCHVNPNGIAEIQNIISKHLSVNIKGNKVVLSGIDRYNKIQFQIFDVQGRMVYYIQPSGRVFNINKPLPIGCYIVRIQADNQCVILKHIVIK